MGITTCVLVIDDEADIREIARISLQITKKWDVLTAASGLEGVDLAVSGRPDLILLDIAMPEMDGFATLKQLRSHPTTEKIPVLLLTATAKVVQQTEYVHFGAQGVLLKPFDPGALGDQIEVALKP